VRQRAGISLFLLVVCGTLLISSWLARQVSAVSRDAYTNIEEFANVLTMVQKNYVDEVGTDKLIDGAINGMLASLDPHSAYLSPISTRSSRSIRAAASAGSASRSPSAAASSPSSRRSRTPRPSAPASAPATRS
jgi:C-terminal processing protease CtpA/Prc